MPVSILDKQYLDLTKARKRTLYVSYKHRVNVGYHSAQAHTVITLHIHKIIYVQ